MKEDWDVLGLIAIAAVVLALRQQRIDDQRGFRERQRLDVLELAKLEDSAGLLLTGRGRLGSRGRRML